MNPNDPQKLSGRQQGKVGELTGLLNAILTPESTRILVGGKVMELAKIDRDSTDVYVDVLVRMKLEP